jgi:hypothetical protein
MQNTGPVSRPTYANGELALGAATADSDALRVPQFLALDADGRIAAITALIGVELERFGLTPRQAGCSG